MPGITVSSGFMQFLEDNPVPNRDRKKPLKVLVLANLSGRSAMEGGQDDLSTRKVRRIDKDNFDEVFSRSSVTLSLPGLQHVIQFEDLDQLTPGHLYENLPIFARYRQLVRDLKSKDRFQQAVNSLRREGLIGGPPGDKPVTEATEQTPDEQESLLDAVFGRSDNQTQNGFSVEALIRETVAPYVEAKSDPRVEEYISAVETAAADLLRNILHSNEFRSVESNWRSLDLLNRRIDTDNACHLYVLDVGQDELCVEAQRHEADPENGSLLPIVESDRVPGSHSYDLIVLGDLYHAATPFKSVYCYLSRTADLMEATFIAGVDFSAVAGEGAQIQFHEWRGEMVSEGWRSLQNEGVKGIFCAPRYMVRLPYGRETRSVENIAFEELKTSHDHSDYLWGSSAYLVVLAIAQEYQQRLLGGASADKTSSWIVDRLPIHVGMDDDGDEKVTPTAETYLTEKTVQAMREVGLTPVQSVKNSDSVLICK